MFYASLLTQLLSTFHEELNQLQIADSAVEASKVNRVIGGSLALAIHGLDIGRAPEDLDFIIYSPTKSQLDYIRQIPDIVDAFGNSPLGSAMQELRSFKLERRGLVLNILLEHYDAPPEHLLTCQYGSTKYRVQSIDNVIKAKNSYYCMGPSKGQRLSLYRRSKDLYDLQQLKNLNFNVPESPKEREPLPKNDYGEAPNQETNSVARVFTTTSGTSSLRDSTGDRRFWPVPDEIPLGRQVSGAPLPDAVLPVIELPVIKSLGETERKNPKRRTKKTVIAQVQACISLPQLSALFTEHTAYIHASDPDSRTEMQQEFRNKEIALGSSISVAGIPDSDDFENEPESFDPEG